MDTVQGERAATPTWQFADFPKFLAEGCKLAKARSKGPRKEHYSKTPATLGTPDPRPGLRGVTPFTITPDPGLMVQCWRSRVTLRPQTLVDQL